MGRSCGSSFRIISSYSLCTIFLWLLVNGTRAEDYSESDVLPDTPVCSLDEECAQYYRHAVCRNVSVTQNDSITDEFRCFCDGEFFFSGSHCVYGAEVGESCATNETVCVMDNSVCRSDGDNVGVQRCLCREKHRSVHHNGTVVCAAVIYEDVDQACGTCESNNGICYDVDGDHLMDGCECPSYTSGIDCLKQHVSVTCDVRTFSMHICYEPHSKFNFDAGAVMIAEGKGTYKACLGVRAQAGDTICKEGDYKLILPLSSGKRDKCGTTTFTTGFGVRRFQNTIHVQSSTTELSGDYMTFSAFCSSRTLAETKFNPFGLTILFKDNQGLYHKPGIEMFVTDMFDLPIPEGRAVRLGDKLFFTINLAADGVFGAIRAEMCLASTSGVLADNEAATLALIVNGCPDPNQLHFNHKNNWQPIVQNHLDELKTGPVIMFKMGQGTAVHFHCLLKLCVVGSESECDPMNCTYPAVHLGYGRRKRAAPDSDNYHVVGISRTLKWIKAVDNSDTVSATKVSEETATEDQSSKTLSPFIVIFIVLTSVMMFFLILAISVVVRACYDRRWSNGRPVVCNTRSCPLHVFRDYS